MSHFFLLNEAMPYEEYNDFVSKMYDLLDIKKVREDIFLKHSSFYSLECYLQLCSAPSQEILPILQFIEQQLEACEVYCSNSEVLNRLFPETKNAFLGIDFRVTTMPQEIQITNQSDYEAFSHSTLWDIDFREVWGKRKQLFPNLILCGEVEKQLAQVGNSTYFNQILSRLKEFDEYCAGWVKGAFSYKEVKKTTSLDISPESSQTIEKFGEQRVFSLPNGSRKTFDLHIKTGNLRFHLYPENDSKEVYIGYIGPHLSTFTSK